MSSVYRSGFLRTKSVSGERAFTGATATCLFHFRRSLTEQEKNQKGFYYIKLLVLQKYACATLMLLVICLFYTARGFHGRVLRMVLSYVSLTSSTRSIDASRMRMEHGEPCPHNVIQMPDRVWPYRPLSSKITGVPSLETVLKIFWEEQMEQLDNLSEFNCQNHLPLCRVRKILKSDPEVKTIRRCDILHAVKKSEIYEFLIDLVPFGPHCVIHQGVPEHAQPEQVLPPAKVILPDMNVPIDMDQAEQENPIAEPFTNNKGFDLNCDLSEHDSAGEEI